VTFRLLAAANGKGSRSDIYSSVDQKIPSGFCKSEASFAKTFLRHSSRARFNFEDFRMALCVRALQHE